MSVDEVKPSAPLQWTAEEIRAMPKPQRLAAVSVWVLSLFEEFAQAQHMVSDNPHFIDEITAIAASAAKQAGALLMGDVDEALREHEACDRLIASWAWETTEDAPEKVQ